MQHLMERGTWLGGSVHGWLEELDGAAPPSRREELAAALAGALHRYMMIDEATLANALGRPLPGDLPPVQP